MKGLTVIGCLLLGILTIGCETFQFRGAGPDVVLMDVVVNEWVEIDYINEAGRSIKINYLNDEAGYAQALAQKVCWHLENSFGDYLLEQETVELRVKVVGNLAYIDVFSLGKQFGSIVYKIQDFGCLDFLAKEIICPELVGGKKPST